MTVETRTTIEPSDITAIEFECVKCHHRTVRSLKDWRNDPAACGNCGSVWSISSEGNVKMAKELVSLIRYFAELREGHPFVVRLEIAKDKVEDKKS
jgi:hypothetical protein